LASGCKVIHMRKGYQYMSHADITPYIQKQPEAKEEEERNGKKIK